MARVEDQMAALAAMTRPQLRAEWRRLLRGQMMPPDAGRDLILRVLSNRLQEKAQGSMLPATARELRRLARQLTEQGQLEMTRQPSLKPGTRLVPAGYQRIRPADGHVIPESQPFGWSHLEQQGPSTDPHPEQQTGQALLLLC